MKRILSILLALVLFLTALLPTTVHAVGDGNMDGGGGGIGDGTSTDYWDTGDEGVRVTVIRVSDHAVVATPIDLTNKHPIIAVNFKKVSKISYTGGRALSPDTNPYRYVNPSQLLPKIITTSGGNGNIAAIKSYFTDEQVIRSIANLTGIDFDVLINGQYRLLLEPIVYMTFGGIEYAMTATEAALYDRQLNGGLRSKMGALSHKNLPLAMFLETSDLGYPAWDGSTTTSASNADIISSLGLGIVLFKEAEPEPEPPEVTAADYEYRVSTEVITSVTVRGGQADPDHPVTVRLTIGGNTYTVSGVYYPEGESQLAWVRWTTPATPQVMDIRVSVSGGGSASQGTISAKIVDISGNDPPNPVADDSNDSYSGASVPTKQQKTSASWGVWRPWWHAYWVWHGSDEDGYWCDHGWWEFDWEAYTASLSATMNVIPDAKDPTASGKTMKSGYGINQTVTADVSTSQSSAVTDAQNAVTYFPEFQYKTYWRLLERTSRGYSSKFEFASNKYSTYMRRSHFTPIWMPDGSYTPYTWLIDCWTPAGMLSMNLTDSVTIRGSLWDDWHIAPVKP